LGLLLMSATTSTTDNIATIVATATNIYLFFIVRLYINSMVQALGSEAGAA